MESDLRSSLLIGRIFVDEPASTSSENALVRAFHGSTAAHSSSTRSGERSVFDGSGRASIVGMK